VRVGDAVSLVAKGFRLLLELFAGIDEHDTALVAHGLVVPQQPDVREDARIVEELVGQHDDGIEPVILQNPTADFALT
jgi:hypothetical protein